MSEPSEDIAAQWLREARGLRERLAKPGLTRPEEMVAARGIDFLRAMIRGEKPSVHIAQTLDFDLIEAEPGRVVFQGNPRMEHYNPLGSIHGGWISTLLDSCMACAVHASLEPGMFYTTLELKVNFVRALTDKVGPVRAEGKAVHVGRRQATAEGRLVDAAGKLYAHGTTTCLIMPAGA